MVTEAARADARRNRARILEVASVALADDPEASLNRIAKLAGVGAGTLYRHFPTREDLILAVYADEIEALAESVERTLATQEPLDAFRLWARRLAAQARVKHGLGDALATPEAQAVIDASFTPVAGAVSRLLSAAEARGQVRPGWDASDVILLLSALWRTAPGEAGLAQADRILEMIIASLATPTPTPTATG